MSIVARVHRRFPSASRRVTRASLTLLLSGEISATTFERSFGSASMNRPAGARFRSGIGLLSTEER